MNAPINAALLAAQAASPRHMAAEQPQVPADMTLLMSGYSHDGLLLDLYGYADEDDGCSVEAVTLTGSKVDLASLLTLAEQSKMGWAVDRAAVQAKQANRDEASADRADWDRRAGP